MSVAKYQVFLKTVECGSFTAAAREMNFTQSGVSHAIGSLEEELGVPLLIRSHGGVTPTADGRALLPYFEKMCAMQHQLEQQAADLRGLETGLVKVATFTSVSEKWLPNILKTFQTHYPHIEFELLPSNFNSEIGNWVLNGQADCGFISLPAPVEKYLDCWLLQRDQWKVIVPCDHPLAGANPFPPAALEQYPLILLDEGDDYEIQAVFDTLGITPKIQYTVQQEDVSRIKIRQVQLLQQAVEQPSLRRRRRRTAGRLIRRSLLHGRCFLRPGRRGSSRMLRRLR